MTNAGTVLVTGANGFIGEAVSRALELSGREVRRALRVAHPGQPNAIVTGELSGETDWRAALAGVRCVVHLAGRAHLLRETAADPLAEYRRVNVAGTLRLAQQAANAGVRRLVYMSSVKVNGESTGTPFTERDAPQPEDPYGLTKWEAEQALAEVARAGPLEVVVLRPPLVYGPGVKGNFLRLLNAVARGWPLPFGSLSNRRSLVYVGNLADAALRAVDVPQAAGRTYLVSDGEDVSTPGLVRAIAAALGTRPRLVPCPRVFLQAAAAALGRADAVRRLTGSLQVDAASIRRELAWRPPHTLAQGLAETARWYHARAKT